jgi:orotidine-5'-phosphate decarboxylase
MLNVHASGGRKMMQIARERLDRSQHRPLLVAVTVLTSLGEGDLGEIGFAGTPADNVRRLAGLAEDSGMDGVVCSPREARMLRADCREGFLLVTPGVRPRDAAKGDQKRVMTPGEAIQAGSNFLVVGRPVTAAPDPLQALERIRAELVLDKVDS